MKGMIDFLNVGGWTLYAILGCSVLATAVFLEKLWTLRRSAIFPRRFLVDIESVVSKKDWSTGIALCRKEPGVLSRIFEEVFENAGNDRERLKEIVFEVGSREVFFLKSYMAVIHMVVTLAPMLGFLGTVLGMLTLFSNIAEVGEVTNVGMIADGIYKALYTTIAGLLVSIPATMMQRYLGSCIERRALEIEENSLRLVNQVVDGS